MQPTYSRQSKCIWKGWRKILTQKFLRTDYEETDKMALPGNKNDLFLHNSSLIGLSRMKQSKFCGFQNQDMTSQPLPLLAMTK